MDLSPAYRKGITENFRNAVITYDPFHVNALVSKAVDEVRRLESRTGDAQAKEDLKGSLYLFRENPENLTERQKEVLDQLDLKTLATGQAYLVRLELRDIYQNSHHRTRAEYRLNAWLNWAWTKCERWASLPPATSQGCQIHREASGWHPCPLGGRTQHRLSRRTQQRLQRRQTQGSRLQEPRLPQNHALFRRW